MTQLDIFAVAARRREESQPYVAGSETSESAARSVAPRAAALRERVFQCIAKHGPVTDEDICRLTGIGPSTARPRRVELVDAGRVREAGRAPGSSGRLMTMWSAA